MATTEITRDETRQRAELLAIESYEIYTERYFEILPDTGPRAASTSAHCSAWRSSRHEHRSHEHRSHEHRSPEHRSHGTRRSMITTVFVIATVSLLPAPPNGRDHG